MKYRHLTTEEIAYFRQLVNDGEFCTATLMARMGERFGHEYRKGSIDARLRRMGIRRSVRWPEEMRASFLSLCRSNPEKPTRILCRAFNELTGSGIYYDLARSWREREMKREAA